jgi:hypothetical protein
LRRARGAHERDAIITAVFSDPPLSKRQLGWLMAAGGSLLAIAALGADLVGAGRYNGLGPVQRTALATAIAIVLFGLSLVPLGHRPA